MADTVFMNNLPSRGIFYDAEMQNIEVREMKPSNIARLYQASTSQDFSLTLDTFGATINVDIRKLTVPDFFWLMYYQRIISYPEHPLDYEWISKYGTTEKFELTLDNVEIDGPKITAEEYEAYKNKGFRMALVRDLEYVTISNLSADKRWLYERAQFLEGTDVEERIELLDTMGMEMLNDIGRFAEKVAHGVKEDIKVKADKPKEEMLAALNERHAKEKDNKELADLIVLVNQANFIPDKETLTISINALKFFPAGI